ncbi:hypothetical protein [Paraclostridium dentum]|uniref:hypothetical protein n=1 Tax=Paraclostridium dentum TaxID=2662455 RepID=UPI003464542E
MSSFENVVTGKLSSIKDFQKFISLLKSFIKGKYLLVKNDKDSYSTYITFLVINNFDNLPLKIYDIAKSFLGWETIEFSFIYEGDEIGYVTLSNEDGEQLYLFNYENGVIEV